MIHDENLFQLAILGSELMLDLAIKHEHGDFLSEIVSKHPHYYKDTVVLLRNYCELIKELAVIFNKPDNEIICQWLKKLSACRAKETKLVFDSFTIELGVNH